MANRDNIWTNKDGLNVGFGTRDVDTNASASVVAGDGQKRRAVMKVVGTGLAAAPTAGQLENAIVVPAGAYILSAMFYVSTAFVGVGAALEVGGWTVADVADDANGFVTATEAAIGNIDADDDAVTGAGAYVGTHLATSVKLAAQNNGTAFTAGVGSLVVEYLNPAN